MGRISPYIPSERIQKIPNHPLKHLPVSRPLWKKYCLGKQSISGARAHGAEARAGCSMAVGQVHDPSSQGELSSIQGPSGHGTLRRASNTGDLGSTVERRRCTRCRRSCDSSISADEVDKSVRDGERMSCRLGKSWTQTALGGILRLCDATQLG